VTVEQVLPTHGLLFVMVILGAMATLGLYQLGAFNAIGKRRVHTRKGETYRVIRETSDGARLCNWWANPSGWFDTWETLAKELDGADAEWAKAKLEEKKARAEL
jgi:type II secretory pathway pseudopilin PulG